jgi:TRAP-type C4-dicarboxylate transport system permease small subunit
MTGLERLLGWLERPIDWMVWVAILAGTLLMIHVSVDVTGRTVFNHPLPGTTEIVSAYYMILAAYLPWAWVAKNDGHISADLFTRMLPPRLAFWNSVGIKVVTIFYTAVFVWQTWLRAAQQTAAGETWQAGAGYIPIWPSRWVLPLAAGLMCLYLVLRVAADLSARLRR